MMRNVIDTTTQSATSKESNFRGAFLCSEHRQKTLVVHPQLLLGHLWKISATGHRFRNYYKQEILGRFINATYLYQFITWRHSRKDIKLKNQRVRNKGRHHKQILKRDSEI